MATIKSYTDIEQSRKLAEILPLESADMWWLYVTAQDKHIAMMYEEPDPHYLARMESYGIKDAAIRCWSLAALLSVLPDELEDNDFLTLQKEKNEYCCCYEDINGNSFRHIFASNPVDACVDMILRLHKLNLL